MKPDPVLDPTLDPTPVDDGGPPSALMPEHWYAQARAQFTGGNEVTLLCGGDELFPAMEKAIGEAQREVWLATYIFSQDTSADAILVSLVAAAKRGVRVRVVLDGFGAKDGLNAIRQRLESAGAGLAVYRPITGWTSWLQPEQLRRLHQKLCAVDGRLAFVGGINVIDDRFDLAHGSLDAPRLDYAVALQGPVVQPVEQMVRALWTRSVMGRDWTEQVLKVARSSQPTVQARRVIRTLQRARIPAAESAQRLDRTPMRAAFVVRDNLRQRRTIELAYIDAIRRAEHRIDLVSPYFYPGGSFRRALILAARRGVKVRLLMQGRWDFRFAAMAARAMYGELMRSGVQIHEYTPAHLHAKVALVDDDWATVGSSNMDPISLLVNLEANVIVRDKAFVQTLAHELEERFAVSTLIQSSAETGWWSGLRRWVVAAGARLYMRFAGITRRY